MHEERRQREQEQEIEQRSQEERTQLIRQLCSEKTKIHINPAYEICASGNVDSEQHANPQQTREEDLQAVFDDPPTVVTENGYRFQSPHELHRYRRLKDLKDRGHILHLQPQKRIEVFINDEKVFSYTADFFYITKSGQIVIEECKGRICEKEFYLKWNILKAIFKGTGVRFKFMYKGRIELDI